MTIGKASESTLINTDAHTQAYTCTHKDIDTCTHKYTHTFITNTHTHVHSHINTHEITKKFYPNNDNVGVIKTLLKESHVTQACLELAMHPRMTLNF